MNGFSIHLKATLILFHFQCMEVKVTLEKCADYFQWVKYLQS